MVTKRLLMPFMAGVTVATVLGATIAFAQNTTISGLAQVIALKFNLQAADVQKVIDQYHQTQQDNMHQEVKNYLDNQVKQGNITSSQESAILGEVANLQSTYNPTGWADLTPAQRQQQAKAMMEELQNWAKSHGIDASKVLMIGKGMMGGMHHGMHDWDEPTETQ